MCLSTLWSKERINALKRAARKNPIRAFKVVEKCAGSLVSSCFPVKYKTGYHVNVTQGKKLPRRKMQYLRAYHVWATRRGAEAWCDGVQAVIPCLVWDIVAAGRQNGYNVIVARKMILLTDYV